MQIHRAKTQGAKQLIIFALGWGADHSVVQHIRPAGCDVWAIYDYRAIEPLTSFEVSGYEQIVLCAWSFGVWAAEQIMGEVVADKAIAFCGTPHPIDDLWGVPKRAFEVTLKGIENNGAERFNRRTYGEYFDHLSPNLNNRPWEERLEELNILYALSTQQYVPKIGWGRAISGSRDLIFPADNTQNYWGKKNIVCHLPHYPFGDAEFIENLLR